jgi:hypothetical protein
MRQARAAVCFDSILAVAVRPDESPCTIPFADPHHHDLRPGEPPEGQLDGGERNEGGQGFGKVLEVLGETPVPTEPGEGALDHPAARQDDEAFMSSLRLTISMRSGGTFATAASTCHAL